MAGGERQLRAALWPDVSTTSKPALAIRRAKELLKRPPRGR
jgi:hypothetical protein